MTASIASLPLTILTHEFFPMKGGIATFVEEIARACVELGQKVEVWAPRTSAAVDSRFPFPVHRVPLRGTHDLGCQLRMIREIMQHRERLSQSILYLPEPGPILAMTHLNLLQAFRPARLLLTFHGSEVKRFAGRPTARYMVGRLIRAADRISTPSHFTRGLLCGSFPQAAEKTVVTPGAPRAGFFNRHVPRVRTSEKVVIVSVGRLHPRKGQRHVIEALDGLPPELASRVEYWIVGRSMRGGYEAELRRRAESCRVAVSFFGSIDHDELELIYARADIFAITPVDFGKSVEGFGLAYLEASAFGLPVIGHAIGGVPEAVRHGETGLLVEPGDTAGLTAAIRQLVTDRALRERMGANGKTWARRHSWADSARLLLDGIAAMPQRRLRSHGALQAV